MTFEAFAHRLPMAHPGDLSALAALIDTGRLDPAHIVAVIGKTEGNGGVNDFTRGYFTQSLFGLLALRLDADAATLAAQIPCILSGGTEGVLSPHYVVLGRREAALPSHRAGRAALAIGVAFSPPMQLHEIGRQAQIDAVAAAVREAIADAGIDDPADVHLVQVKVPCVTVARAEAAAAADHAAAGPLVSATAEAGPAVHGAPPDTVDPGRSMALSRAAGAFGIARALGDLDEAAASADGLLRDFSRYSDRASVSSGVEVVANEVVVLGNSPAWSGSLRVSHRAMASALDLPAVIAALADLGIAAAPQVAERDRPRLAAVLVKCEPDRRGRIHGNRHTMLDDTDINAQRHIRGAVGGMVAGVVADGRLFVSGGAEHQGPDGGGLIAIIAEDGSLLAS